MKLKINNKIFIGKYNSDNELVIPLEEDSDILFFKEWCDKSTSGIPKKDYIKSIRFEKVTGSGILENCFPILHLNEDFVKIVYDYFVDIK